jgi:hypothetical protein
MSQLQPQTRSQLAQRLLSLEDAVAPLVAESDKLKDQLRTFAATEGFSEIIPGVGKVTVGMASASKLTGVFQTLSMEKWIELPLEEQLVLVKSGLVVNEKRFSQNRKSSVSVTLDPNTR